METGQIKKKNLIFCGSTFSPLSNFKSHTVQCIYLKSLSINSWCFNSCMYCYSIYILFLQDELKTWVLTCISCFISNIHVKKITFCTEIEMLTPFFSHEKSLQNQYSPSKFLGRNGLFFSSHMFIILHCNELICMKEKSIIFELKSSFL